MHSVYHNLNGFPTTWREEKVLLTGHFGHYLRRSEAARIPGAGSLLSNSPSPHFQPGPMLKSQVDDLSALVMVGGKSSSPIWLVKAASTVADRRIWRPSSSPPRSSMR